MLSLIIDTTGSQAFIGLAENDSLLSKIIISEGRQLSKFLLPSIQSILQARTPNDPTIGDKLGSGPMRKLPGSDDCKSIHIRNMDRLAIVEPRGFGTVQIPSLSPIVGFIAIGTGPGSFTGSRVGGIVAHSLSYGWNIPLISFSSTLLPDLDAIAALSYEKYLSGERSAQIELVYISSTP